MSKFRQMSQLPDDIDCRLGAKVDPNAPKADEPPCARERALQRVTDLIFDLDVAFKELDLAFSSGTQAFGHLGALFEELEDTANRMAGKPVEPRVAASMFKATVEQQVTEQTTMNMHTLNPYQGLSEKLCRVPYRFAHNRSPFVNESDSMGAWAAGPDDIHKMVGIDPITAKIGLEVLGQSEAATISQGEMHNALVALKIATSADSVKNLMALCTGEIKISRVSQDMWAAMTFTARLALQGHTAIAQFADRLLSWAMRADKLEALDAVMCAIRRQHPDEHIQTHRLMRVFSLHMQFGSVIENV